MKVYEVVGVSVEARGHCSRRMRAFANIRHQPFKHDLGDAFQCASSFSSSTKAYRSAMASQTQWQPWQKNHIMPYTPHPRPHRKLVSPFQQPRTLVACPPALGNNLGHLVHLSLRTPECAQPLLRKLPCALILAITE